MKTQFNVAVVGATGLVGEMMINVLEERAFPVAQLFPLASNRSIGRSVSFRGRSYPVSELGGFDFGECDFALFSAGAAVSREHAPRAVAAGCLVIDNTSQFRYDESVPLVVPEVNPQALERVGRSGIIANPNCSTIQLVVALKPLHAEAHLERVEVATYQSVSGAGRAALEDLARQSIAVLSGKGPAQAAGGAKPIAFNCVPHIDVFQDNGYTREEMKIVWETRKILGEPQLRVNATAVRVPVFYGHSEVVHIETARPLSASRARELLDTAPGVTVLDERRPGGYPTATTEAANRDTVYVGRIREDLAPDRGLNLWIVADNVRKGAATNSVQIAEALARRPI
ncbi:MAG: aspartate-semialdehyde dehydrogenase [Gammaproteobacteria bacterium]|nr:aspartate-semialdehyde dehydrogenase [Gammaproteobacteria bacterium]